MVALLYSRERRRRGSCPKGKTKIHVPLSPKDTSEANAFPQTGGISIIDHLSPQNARLSPKRHKLNPRSPDRHAGCVSESIANLTLIDQRHSQHIQEGVQYHQVFLDLSKAYDTVDKGRMIMILKGYGVGPNLQEMHRSYLGSENLPNILETNVHSRRRHVKWRKRP